MLLRPRLALDLLPELEVRRTGPHGHRQPGSIWVHLAPDI